jgi:hypothetical protein
MSLHVFTVRLRQCLYPHDDSSLAAVFASIQVPHSQYTRLQYTTADPIDGQLHRCMHVTMQNMDELASCGTGARLAYAS